MTRQQIYNIVMDRLAGHDIPDDEKGEIASGIADRLCDEIKIPSLSELQRHCTLSYNTAARVKDYLRDNWLCPTKKCETCDNSCNRCDTCKDYCNWCGGHIKQQEGK